MARIDYLDDPEAPKANSLVPSANAIVLNAAGEILLIRRTDNGNWSLPGGAMEIGETILDAAVREVREETGIDCEITGLAGIYTNPNHVLEYTSDGEVRQEFSVVFTAAAISGEATPSDESSEVVWIAASRLGAYGMHPSMRLRVDNYLSRANEVYLG